MLYVYSTFFTFQPNCTILIHLHYGVRTLTRFYLFVFSDASEQHFISNGVFVMNSFRILYLSIYFNSLLFPFLDSCLLISIISFSKDYLSGSNFLPWVFSHRDNQTPIQCFCDISNHLSTLSTIAFDCGFLTVMGSPNTIVIFDHLINISSFSTQGHLT